MECRPSIPVAVRAIPSINRPSAFNRKEICALLTIVIISILIFDSRFYASTLEDAYITFRYSKHFAEGYGFGAWNKQGERVEGYSTFLWMLFLSVGYRAGVDIRTFSKIAGIFVHIILCSTLIAFPLLHRRTNEDTIGCEHISNESVLAGIFLAFYMPLAWYATSGMETILFSTLVTLIFIVIFLPWSAVFVPLITVLLILVRPEGVLVVAAALTLYFMISVIERRSLLGVIVSVFSACLSIVCLTVHRLIVFGDIVPNTYWAKAGGASHIHMRWGIGYVIDWAYCHRIIILFVCISAVCVLWSLRKTNWRQWQWRFLILACFFLGYTAYIMKVGGDNYFAFPYWRHFVHLAGPLALLLSFTLTRLWPRSRYFHLAVLIVLILLTNWAIAGNLRVPVPRPYRAASGRLSYSHMEHNEYFLRLKELSHSFTTIASGLGGELPYVVDAIHIDCLGLNTRYIAKNGTFDPKGPQDSKTDMRWVMEQHPDIIESNIPGTLLMTATRSQIEDYIDGNWRSKMLKELVTSPIFLSDYLFVRKWPYAALDRALFIKESYAIKYKLVEILDCVPIGNTPLGLYAESNG